MRFEGDDFSIPVHNGTIGLDGSSDDIVIVLEVDDEHFGLRIVAWLLSNADVTIGL